MEHNTNKENWIDEALNSTRGMMRAQPDGGLYERITRQAGRPRPASVPFPVIRWAAAAVLLVAVNISSVIYFNSHSRASVAANTANPIAAAIQSETTYNY